MRKTGGKWKTALAIAIPLAGLVFGGLANSGFLDATQLDDDFRQSSQQSFAPGNCPSVEDITATIDTVVTTTNRQLLANTSAKVTLKGVQPPNPGWESAGYDLRPSTGDDYLSWCILGAYGTVKSFDWTAGTITAELAIPLATNIETLGSYYGGGGVSNVRADVALRRGITLSINPCAANNPLPAESPSAYTTTSSKTGEIAYLCRPTSHTALHVHVQGIPGTDISQLARTPLGQDPPVRVGSEPASGAGAPSDPFPNSADHQRDSFTYGWTLAGPSKEPIRIWIDVPLRVGIGMSIPYWSVGLGCAGSFACAALFSWGTLTSLASPLLMLLAAAMLRERSVERRWLRAPMMILGIFLMIGVTIRSYPSYVAADSMWSSGLIGVAIPVIAGWCLIIAALLIPADPLLRPIDSRWPYRFPVVGLLITAVGIMSMLGIYAWQGWRDRVGSGPPPTYGSCSALGSAPSPWLGNLLLIGFLLLITTLGVGAILQRVSALFALQDSVWTKNNDVTRAVFAVGYLALGSTIGYVVVGPLIASLRYEDISPIPGMLSSIGHGLARASTTFAIQLVGLVALAYVASVLLQRIRTQPTNWKKMGWVVGLLLTLAVPFTTTGTIPFGIDFPIWIVQAGVLVGIFQQLLSRFVPPAPAKRAERTEALKHVRLRAASADQEEPVGSESDQATYGHRILELGGGNGGESTARMVARLAASMSIVPVAYLVWTALTVASWQSWGSATLAVILSVLTEAARWLITGFVFGLIYNSLPTRTGPTKALCYTAIWAAGAWAAVLVARMAGTDVATETLYRTVQFGAFVFVLGLLVDMQAIRRAGGTWRDLRKVYALHGIFEIAAAGLPAALLAIALVQQISTGAGADIAETIISGFNDMSSAIKPKG